MSRLIQKYEAVVQALLSADSVPGLGRSLLDSFKCSHGAAAFFCRLISCAAASEAFHTKYTRDEHEELVHMKRLPCQVASCQYTSIGFRTSTDLKRHMQAYHSGPRPSIIPPSIRRMNSPSRSSLPRLRDSGIADLEESSIQSLVPAAPATSD